MKRQICRLTILVLLFMNLAQAQSTRQGGTKKNKEASANLQPATATTVTGSGTPGRLSKWVGTSGSSTFVLGDSNLFEDKFGKVGIGVPAPTSPLTVQGMIETTLGGYKFPDNTVQTTAAVSGLLSVVHNATLTGNGTAASPLGVAVPLNLTAAVPPASRSAVIKVTNTADSGDGVRAIGGDSSSSSGGTGVVGIGGNSDTHSGGTGVRATGGLGDPFGGVGVRALGGPGRIGGDGVHAFGADSIGNGNIGSAGIFATGGRSGDGTTFGPAGLFAGDVQINGDLNVIGTKNFRIDHPLDPENKYLVHAAIESSEVLNVYSGNVKTNEQGEATVILPDWADVKVSWQVTGARADARMQKHPFKTEENKPERERGTYLSPEAFNQPEERSVEWARRPELMRRMKESRQQMKQQAPADNP